MRHSKAPTLLVLAASGFMMTGCTESGAESSAPAWTGTGPRYASTETKEVIERMVDAHGGMEAWERAPSVSYDNVFFNPYSDAAQGADPWWVVHEQIEQGRRRVIQDWTIDEGLLVYDGERTWSKGYQKGNPPTFMVYFFYYFTQLPWLTQDDFVELSNTGIGRLPLREKEYVTVEMTYSRRPAAGKTEYDSYKLYIDPNSYLLAGYEYSVAYGAMVDLLGVDPSRRTFGPMLRVHDGFTTVDGLTVPSRMATWAPDHSVVYGHHVILNYNYRLPFDERRLQMPDDAEIDAPQYERSAARQDQS